MKTNEYKFTIQFSENDPQHRQAAEILNSKGRRSKAPYLAAAIMHYENRTPGLGAAAPLDTRAIEAVVYRLLKEMGLLGTQAAPEPDKPKRKPAATPPAAKKMPQETGGQCHDTYPPMTANEPHSEPTGASNGLDPEHANMILGAITKMRNGG